MQEPDFSDVLEQILRRDPRYHCEAYQFLREALDYTQKSVSKINQNKIRHVTGQELLAGIREFGLSQFGPMTLNVFEEWGVRRGEDFGEIVFNLVESGLLSKTEQDSHKDFGGAYDFFAAFREPFLPKTKTAPSAPKQT